MTALELEAWTQALELHDTDVITHLLHTALTSPTVSGDVQRWLDTASHQLYSKANDRSVTAWLHAFQEEDSIVSALRHIADKTDAREVMHMLCHVSAVHCRQVLHSYIRLLKQTYQQLFLDTLRRCYERDIHGDCCARDSLTVYANKLGGGCGDARDATSTLHYALSNALSVMRPWATDALRAIDTTILPGLACRDALLAPPDMLADPSFSATPTATLDYVTTGSTVNDGGRQGGVVAASVNTVALKDACCETLLLLRLLRSTCHLSDAVLRHVLALFAAFVSGQPCNAWVDLYGLPASERIALITEWARADPEGTIDAINVCDADLHLSSEPDACSAIEHSWLRDEVWNLVIEVAASMGETSSIESLLHLAMAQHDESPLPPEDLERGALVPSSTRAWTAWHEQDDVTAELRLVDDHRTSLASYGADDDDKVDEVYPREDGRNQNTLTLQGALFMIGDALVNPAPPAAARGLACSLFTYSCSAGELLLSLSPIIQVALHSPSLTSLLSTLVLSHALVRAVPPCSLCLLKENKQAQLALGDARRTDANAPHDHTRRYNLVFKLIRQLITLTVTCPSSAHRWIAHTLTMHLLRRLEVWARLRMYCSLLITCPYASVTEVLLRAAVRDYNCNSMLLHISISDEDEAIQTRVGKFLEALAVALDSFLHHVRIGNVSFATPLIVALNFFRVVFAREQGSVDGTAVVGWESGAWSTRRRWRGGCALASRLERDVLPKCRALLSQSSSVTTSNTVEGVTEFGLTNSAQLSPPAAERDTQAATSELTAVDLFAIEDAVTGLQNVLSRAIFSTPPRPLEQ